jgi:hypothetical protein
MERVKKYFVWAIYLSAIGGSVTGFLFDSLLLGIVSAGTGLILAMTMESLESNRLRNIIYTLEWKLNDLEEQVHWMDGDRLTFQDMHKKHEADILKMLANARNDYLGVLRENVELTHDRINTLSNALTNLENKVKKHKHSK